MEDSEAKSISVQKPIRVGDHVEIVGILYRVIRVKPNSRKVVLEAVAKIRQEANA